MKSLVSLTLLIGMTSCGGSSKNEYLALSSTNEIEVVYQDPQAKLLLEKHCNVCHSPTAPQGEGRIAPPMVAVKMHYIEKYPKKDDFVKAMIDFVNRPSEEASLMPGAVRKFGLMPYQQFPNGSITEIASYLYDYTIESPIWFPSHWEKMGKGRFKQKGAKENVKGRQDGSHYMKQSWETKGLEIALKTKEILGKELMGTIQKNGVLNALEFCSTNAIPITDSVGVVNGVSIKRISDRNRNSLNKASEMETRYIHQFQSDMQSGIEPQPIVEMSKDQVQFYYPIMTNSMCLQCHGETEKSDQKYTIKLKNCIHWIWRLDILRTRLGEFGVFFFH